MSSNPGFELHGLQKLFSTYVTTARTPRCFLDPVLIQELVIGEVARIKLRLIESSCAIKSEEAVRKYVQIHQYAIVAIMDKLFQRRDQPAALECCDVIDGLLSSLREHFPKYFDELGKAPLKHIHEMRIKIQLSFQSLERQLLKVCAFETFVYMIIDPLERFYSSGERQSVTFHRLRYLSYILKHSKKVIEDGRASDEVDRSLLDFMLYLNYNSRKTYMQVVQFFSDILPMDLDIETKRDTLSLYKKVAMRATVKPNTGYHPHAPTLKSQLIDFFTAEIAELDAETKRFEAHEPTSEYRILGKIKFDLSVSQLAYLLRLLIDTGVVCNENMADVIRWVVHNCETKQSKNISAESLRTKLYEVEESTKRAVRQKITDFLKFTDTLPG